MLLTTATIVVVKVVVVVRPTGREIRTQSMSGIVVVVPWPGASVTTAIRHADTVDTGEVMLMLTNKTQSQKKCWTGVMVVKKFDELQRVEMRWRERTLTTSTE